MKKEFSAAYGALCQSLTEARQAAELTQKQLAERLGKPQSFVSKYEQGERRLDVVEFLFIAEALGLDSDDLLSRVRVTLRTNSPGGSP